jgi:hypothetical protein
MAKISANGATEVAKIRTTSHGGRVSYLWVINSKGVILWRQSGEYGSGYTVQSRHNEPTREALMKAIARMGHTLA